jgi:hypothetical protein
MALVTCGGLAGCSSSAHRSVQALTQEEQPGTIHFPPPAQTPKQAEGTNPKNTDMAASEISDYYHLDTNKSRAECRVRLAREFPNLTPINQYMVLAFLWPQARCPEFADSLLHLAKLPNEPEQENVETLCDEVFIRLLEVKPEAVRPLILQDLRRPNPLFAMCVLRALPDKELPELDYILLAHLNNRRDDIERAALIIERYASPRIMAQVIAFYHSSETGWECSIQTAVLRYELKYDRPAGLEAIEKAANFRKTTCCYKTVLGETLHDSLDRGSEKLVLKYVNDPDPQVASDARTLLAQ